ncbi:hypothetical protein [Succinatimonas hippei]|uniref:hypothetical protein n=1 Tax=Succinatimonas hippei TaxID=626938 RepID=UPI002492EBC7|nr:hypothetical protein [Succinatimonas hippei]
MAKDYHAGYRQGFIDGFYEGYHNLFGLVIAYIDKGYVNNLKDLKTNIVKNEKDCFERFEHENKRGSCKK